MGKRVYQFQAEVFGDVINDGVKPIYDEYNNLIGGFAVLRGNILRCTVGGDEYPAALVVTSEESFYLTSRMSAISDKRQVVSHCILSEQPLGPDSIKVSMATEENIIGNTVN
jgi:hypothetical protein